MNDKMNKAIYNAYESCDYGILYNHNDVYGTFNTLDDLIKECCPKTKQLEMLIQDDFIMTTLRCGSFQCNFYKINKSGDVLINNPIKFIKLFKSYNDLYDDMKNKKGSIKEIIDERTIIEKTLTEMLPTIKPYMYEQIYEYMVDNDIEDKSIKDDNYQHYIKDIIHYNIFAVLNIL